MAPCFALFWLWASLASATTIAAPVGGRGVTMPDGRVVCATPTGWSVSADGRTLTPPALTASTSPPAASAPSIAPPAASTTAPTARAAAPAASSVTVVVAASTSACATSKETATFLALAALPSLDEDTITAYVDERRIEAVGTHLAGATLRWSAAGASGVDVCDLPTQEGTGSEPPTERCSWQIGSGLPADAGRIALQLRPRGVPDDPTTYLFDREGARIGADGLAVHVARVVIAPPITNDGSVDTTGGQARIALRHPEAIATVDCGALACDVNGSALVVRASGSNAANVVAVVRLLPRVYVRRGGLLERTSEARLPVTRCPLTVASGAPLREATHVQAVLRLGGRCASDASALTFRAGGAAARVVRVERDKEASWIVLAVDRIDGAELTFEALRDDETLVAAATQTTAAPPTIRAVVRVDKLGVVDFVPSNTWAAVTIAASLTEAKVVLLDAPGAYDVQRTDAQVSIRAANGASGVTRLRFVIRRDGLPLGLDKVDLAELVEPVSRPLREANRPLPLVTGDAPLVEVICAEGGRDRRVAPGEPHHLPFDRRDGCRLVFHRERIDPSAGAQKLHLELDVSSLDGTPRADARVSKTVTLAHAATPRISYIKGAAARFDRISLRLSHAGDGAHYGAGALDDDAGLPEAQWRLVTGLARARLYATTAVPTGLYRVSDADHSGVLSLNFGVLARLTWLDGDGTEGFAALEGGVVGVGFVDKSATAQSLADVAAVMGVGIGVPIANRSSATEASVNLHAWLEYEPPRAVSGNGNPWGFVFGPSISIGNIGLDL